MEKGKEYKKCYKKQQMFNFLINCQHIITIFVYRKLCNMYVVRIPLVLLHTTGVKKVPYILKTVNIDDKT